ncbi:MAG: histidine phosphatase family protein, partial [Gammaproteobacteria bacterium]|nr:histidine phosphatase family protein [Gammaproteobacteria bacterium]
QGLIQGRSDISISESGRSSAEAWILPDDMRKARWFSSPLLRARQTASILGIRCKADDRLIEMSWGEWEGESLCNLRDRYGESMTQNESLGLDFYPPGGESPRMVQDRIKPWLEFVGNLNYPVGAVTHRGVIRAVTALATGWDMTGKELHKLRPGTCRQFCISATGLPVLLQPDISLVQE